MIDFDLNIAEHKPVTGTCVLDAPAPSGIKYAIVRIPDYGVLPFDNTVMAAAVNDQAVPTKIMKGDKMFCRAFFNIMSQIMTAPALQWATKPNMLWINDRYFQDIDWPDADRVGRPPSDREPISECIYYPCNFIAWDYRVGNWFHLVSYKNTDPPTNPFMDNWQNKPHLWGKAQALSKDGKRITNVGEGLDVYLPLIKQTEHTWMHLSQIELFPELPFTLDDGNVIIRYELQSADVIGVTQAGTFLYLRKVGKFTGMSEPYNWHLQTRSVIPPT